MTFRIATVPLELWILLVLAVLGIGLAVFARLRRRRRSETPVSGDNVYPLW